MAWWATALLQASPFIYEGVSNLLSGNAQAEVDEDYALYNSIVLNQVLMENAKSSYAIAEFNSAATLAAAEASNIGIRALTEYNSAEAIFLGEYEAQLLENEALLILEASRLDMEQLGISQASELGEIKATSGASGAIMDIDTPGAVVAETERQQELERFILQRSADVSYLKLKDEAAFSRAMGYKEAGEIALEGAVMEQSNIVNANISGYTTMAQALINYNTDKDNAWYQASNVLTEGLQNSDSSSYYASSSFWSGLFGAGTSFASSYIKQKSGDDTYEKIKSLLG